MSMFIDKFDKKMSLKLSHCGPVTLYGNIKVGHIGSGNGLLPDSTKPLPEPLFNYDHNSQKFYGPMRVSSQSTTISQEISLANLKYCSVEVLFFFNSWTWYLSSYQKLTTKLEDRQTEGQRNGRIWWFHDASVYNKVGGGIMSVFHYFGAINDFISINITQNVQNIIAGTHCRQNEKGLLHLPIQCIGFPNTIQQNHSSPAILVKRRQSPASLVLSH